MRKSILLSLLLCNLVLLGLALAQENTENRAVRRTSELEKELVNKVRSMLGNDSSDSSNVGKTAKTEETKAQMPTPERLDLKRLEEEFGEWKAKSVYFSEKLKEKEKDELQKELALKILKLEEKMEKAEKVVLNPKRKPDRREVDRMARALQREREKLEREYAAKLRKVEEEYEHQEEVISQLVEEIGKSIKAAKKEKSGKNNR